MATNVVIQSNPLADFLNKIPELIFEAKAYGEELDWKTEQAELERAHEKEIKDLEFNRQFAGQLYQQNQALEQSIAELGIISTQAENLPDEQKTPGFDSFTDVISGKLEGDSNQIKETISYLEEDYGSNLKTIASYNMGKNLFTQVDQNADGTIDDEEKAKYAEEYGDLDIDYNAFSQGIYASELGAEQLAALDLSKEELKEIQLKNEYLPMRLRLDEKYKKLQVETLGVENKTKAVQLEQATVDLERTRKLMVTDQIAIDQAQATLDDTLYTLDAKKIENTRFAIADQEQNAIENGQYITNSILNNLVLFEKDWGKVTSLYDFYLNNAGHKIDEEWKVNIFGKGHDYSISFDNWDESFEGRVDASIESDIKGLFTAMDMSYDTEAGTFGNTRVFSEEIDKIHGEILQMEANNYAVQNIVKIEKEFMKVNNGKSAYENPSAFLEFVNETYGVQIFGEDSLVELARYMQFKEMGFLEGDLLELNRRNLDQAIDVKNINERINMQTMEAENY